MAKATLIDRKATGLTDAEKAILKADKAIVAIAKSGDASVLNGFFARNRYVESVLNQQGNGKGLRFNGAANHDFAENLRAYAETVTRGMIPTAKGESAPAPVK